MKKDFIAVADYSPEELKEMLDLAVDLKKEYFKKGNQPILKGKVLGMIFNKPSLRTRISFDMAMRHLGGDALFISPAEIGLVQRESIADVARVMSGYVHGIMARVFAHSHVTELAKWSSVPVINGLSDYNHPCQAMADVMTIYEKFGKLKGLKVTFIGDGNNVAVSLLHACSKLGLDFSIASPEGYDLDDNAWKMAEGFAVKSDSKLNKFRDPRQAVAGVDVIYTDTWTSMGQEEETEKRKNVFPPYQVNTGLVDLASKDAIVMHCLPAHRGQEITDEVADGPHSVLFPQAHNRLHAQKAILVKLLTLKCL
ncbi:MAG: ornithine carbamoyltransferase [Pelolinea sp.]|nr:ornithine carbamoyltransferase [Pelolinea sp.]